VAAGANGLERGRQANPGLRAARYTGRTDPKSRAVMNVASDVNEDFVDMLSALTDNEVDFLVVGAYALALAR
jgi:hypothetical protein